MASGAIKTCDTVVNALPHWQQQQQRVCWGTPSRGAKPKFLRLWKAMVIGDVYQRAKLWIQTYNT